jgi:hypothetical protein
MGGCVGSPPCLSPESAARPRRVVVFRGWEAPADGASHHPALLTAADRSGAGSFGSEKQQHCFSRSAAARRSCWTRGRGVWETHRAGPPGGTLRVSTGVGPQAPLSAILAACDRPRISRDRQTPFRLAASPQRTSGETLDSGQTLECGLRQRLEAFGSRPAVPDLPVNPFRFGRREPGNLARVDPEERDELLREVDEELDDTPKGRAIKDTIKGLSTTKPAEADDEE